MDIAIAYLGTLHFFSLPSTDGRLSAHSHAQDRTHTDAAVRRRIRRCSFFNTETLTVKGAQSAAQGNVWVDCPVGERRREHVWNQLPWEEQHPSYDGKRPGLVSDAGRRIAPPVCKSRLPMPKDRIKILVRQQRAEGPSVSPGCTANPLRRGDDSQYLWVKLSTYYCWGLLLLISAPVRGINSVDVEPVFT